MSNTKAVGVAYSDPALTDAVLTTPTISGGTMNSTTVGATTASSGAFTTLSATGAVSGAGFTAYMAAPAAIGGTTPAAGSFTTLAASSTVSGNGITALFASPPAIGGTKAAAGTFAAITGTDLTATGNVGVGTNASSTLGFYGATKIAQRASAVQATSLVGTASSSDFDTATKAAIIEIMDTLKALGLWKGSA